MWIVPHWISGGKSFRWRIRDIIRTYAFLLHSDGYSDPMIDRLPEGREESLSNAEDILSRLNGVA